MKSMTHDTNDTSFSNFPYRSYIVKVTHFDVRPVMCHRIRYTADPSASALSQGLGFTPAACIQTPTMSLQCRQSILSLYSMALHGERQELRTLSSVRHTTKKAKLPGRLPQRAGKGQGVNILQHHPVSIQTYGNYLHIKGKL